MEAERGAAIVAPGRIGEQRVIEPVLALPDQPGERVAIVGAGGIGFYIQTYVRSFQYDKAASVTIAVIVILAGAWFSGGPDRLKNALIACAIAVGIVQAPTIVSSLINSAGALI